MNSIDKLESTFPETPTIKHADNIVMNADKLPDIVLKRLMDEVKNDSANQMFAYDRAHNRHNRGR